MTAPAVAMPDTSLSAEEQRVREARRLLPIDPTTALRTLDLVSPASGRRTYQDALALRVIANSMLGLRDSAIRSVKDLAALSDRGRGCVDVAGWLLNYSGERFQLAAPLMDGGCGRARCDHEFAVELALQAVREADGGEPRLATAAEFARIRPDLTAFKLAQAQALHGAGRVDDAIAFLTSFRETRMTRAAGIMLYGAGRFEQARSLLADSGLIGEAAALGALQAVGIGAGAPVPASIMDYPMLRAIHLEASGHWQDAVLAWKDADRPTEAWVAGLMAGSVDAPIEGAEPRWMWRYYALTGRGRPGSAPRTKAQQRHAALGRTRELLSQLRAGGRPQLTESEDDPFEIEGLLDLVMKGYGEPVVVASRLIALDPPEQPMELLPLLMHLPPKADWLGSESRRRAWRDWIDAHPAAQIPGPRVAQYARLSKVLRADDQPDPRGLAGQLDGLPRTDVVSAAGIALAKGWGIDDDLARSLVEPATITACLDTARADLLPVLALVAGAQDLPDDLRRVAGEICGALVALAQSRGEVASDAGRAAVVVIEDSLAEIAPIAAILGPTSAYEHETTWVDGVRKLRAGPILASRAGLDASSARMPRGRPAHLYGSLGRAHILAAAGQLESAMVAAECADVDDAEREGVVRELKSRLAARRAAVGDIDGAIRLAVECKPDGGAAAGRIASEIMDRVEPAGRDTAIKQLETLHDAYPTVGGVSVMLARLLNQRAVTAQRNDAPIRSYISDMERAGRLDPDSIQIRSNLAQTYFGRAAEVWERYPDQAMGDLRKAVATDPNSGELRSAGSQLALACASANVERRNRREAKVCLEYAVQLDPSNTEAFRAAMMLR